MTEDLVLEEDLLDEVPGAPTKFAPRVSGRLRATPASSAASRARADAVIIVANGPYSVRPLPRRCPRRSRAVDGGGRVTGLARRAPGSSANGAKRSGEAADVPGASGGPVLRRRPTPACRRPPPRWAAGHTAAADRPRAPRWCSMRARQVTDSRSRTVSGRSSFSAKGGRSRAGRARSGNDSTNEPLPAMISALPPGRSGCEVLETRWGRPSREPRLRSWGQIPARPLGCRRSTPTERSRESGRCSPAEHVETHAVRELDLVEQSRSRSAEPASGPSGQASAPRRESRARNHFLACARNVPAKVNLPREPQYVVGPGVVRSRALTA